MPYSLQPRGREAPSLHHQGNSGCLNQTDRSQSRHLAYKLRLKHLSPREWADPVSVPDTEGMEKRVCSYGAFSLIPVYTKRFAHLFLAAAPFRLWSLGRYRVMQTGERAFPGRRRQCETPVPTPVAPTPTHPQCSGPSALPAVQGSWRAIFNRTSHSISEAETIKAQY